MRDLLQIANFEPTRYKYIYRERGILKLRVTDEIEGKVHLKYTKMVLLKFFNMLRSLIDEKK